jgi:hypothetical protein
MRITEEEASYFLPFDEFQKRAGYDIRDCNFTVTATDSEWEDVTYYTNIKRATDNYEGDGPYYVYVLENDGYGKGVYKIGYTKHHPDHRAKQLSRGTGIIYPFKVKYVFRCHDGEFLEREVHKALNEYRLSKDREFFNVEFSLVKEVIEELGTKYKGN